MLSHRSTARSSGPTQVLVVKLMVGAPNFQYFQYPVETHQIRVMLSCYFVAESPHYFGLNAFLYIGPFISLMSTKKSGRFPLCFFARNYSQASLHFQGNAIETIPMKRGVGVTSAKRSVYRFIGNRLVVL